MKPTLVIVGRPNVGKSTLFNRLTRTRDALVADVPGLTRDRHYGVGRLGDRPYLAVDTGGLEPEATGVFVEMARQVRTAIAEADAIVLVTDAREGLTARDRAIGEELRRLGGELPELRFVAALSEADTAEGWDGETGLITDVVDRLEADLSEVDAYLCGPPPMVDAAIELLKAQGLAEQHIFYDKFTTTAETEESSLA